MAMFQYFPNNYVWNLSVDIAIESGARIGEIEEMCRPLLEAAKAGEDAGTPQFMREWVKMADKLVGLAAEDEALGRRFSAGTKLQRASVYYITAERMQGQGTPERNATFQKGQDSFRRAMALGNENAERVEIAVPGGIVPGVLTRAEGTGPVVVFVNGLDSCKELLNWTGLPQVLLRRGISPLCIDQPGSGEALRAGGLPATHESERWATPIVDWLETQPGIDAHRIGLTGISIGGYFVPRAIAFEPRFAAGAV